MMIRYRKNHHTKKDWKTQAIKDVTKGSQLAELNEIKIVDYW